MKIQGYLFALSFLLFARATIIAQEQTYPVTAASFPKEVIPVEGGKIEIKAKFHDLSGVISYNEPFLFWITDGVSTYKLGFYKNSGLVGTAGDGFFVRSNPDEELRELDVILYENLIDDINDWHLYTLLWDKNGIPGIDDGTRKVAILVDGSNYSGFWEELPGSHTFPSLTSGTLNLITQQAPGALKPMVSVKDLVIYDKDNNILLTNSLASANEISNSLIGQNGEFNGGGNASFPYFDAIQSNALTAHPIFSISEPGVQLNIECAPVTNKPYTKNQTYFLPELSLTGLFSNVYFSISGSTTRNGYGLNASGNFEIGTSEVLWKAIDKDGIEKTCIQSVKISEPSDNDPGWTFSAPINTESFNGILIPAGDINGDGYNELVIAYNQAWMSAGYDSRFGKIKTFFGSSEGLSPGGIESRLANFYGAGDYLPDFSLFPAGDINKDGFDDLIAGNVFGQESYLFYGSNNGLVTSAGWIWRDDDGIDYLGFANLGKYAGDVNGDGYSDIVITGEPISSVVVFYGSPSGFKSFIDWSFWLPDNNPKEGFSAGDINNDGIDDLLVIYADNLSALFMGSTGGLSNTPLYINKFSNEYQTQVTSGGDINGDHFNDIIISGYSQLDSATYILYGSAFGLDTAGVKIGYLNSPNFVGDINGDGFDDMVGNRLIFYGSTKGFFPIPDALVVGLTHQVGKAGDINHDGFDDVLGRTIDEMQLYFGFDKSQVYQERIDLCGTKDKQYSLPELYVNLPGSTVQYTLNGATKRSGSGTDASGTFNNGTSYLLWKVSEQDGKQYSWKTTVMVSPYLGVDINDAYAVMPGGEPNTIYLGYGKQNLTLRAKVTGGQGKRTYKWSTGSNASSINVRPTIAGSYWYRLWVTDAKGCMSADSVMVKVIDVRCDQKVNNALDYFLPGWQSWKVLQGFVKDNSFVKVCIPLKGKWISTCVAARMVPSVLAKGGKLGACQANSNLIVKTEVYSEPKESEAFSIKVSPNPSPAGFSLQVNGNKNEPLQIIIRDPLGRTVETINCAYTSRLVIGTNLQKGMYFVEVRQESLKRVAKIMKL